MTPRANSNANYVFWVTVVCQGRSITLTIWWGMSIVGEAVHVGRQNIGESFVLSAPFCCKAKTALKKESCFFKNNTQLL